jgi:transketolase
VKILPDLDAAGINVKVIAAISEELFDRQPAAYRNSVLPAEAVNDLMFVMSGTRRMWPLRNVGTLCDEYSLTADAENRWLTGGSEADVIAEAHLDPKSILAGVQRFAQDRPKRLQQQRALLEALG